jgi:transcription elongation GreA/GreB family factor
MPAQLGMRDDVIMRDHAKEHGLHDDPARAAAARTVASGGRGPQTRMTGGDPAGYDAVRRLDHLVDETLKASFPASDPPGWTLGGPRREPHRPEDLDDMTDSARAQPTIYVTTHDYERLSALADFYKSRRPNVAVDFLLDELDRAELVAAADVAAKVVTMNARARIMDPDTGEARTVTLVYPGEEDSARQGIGPHAAGHRPARPARGRPHGKADPR